MFNVQHDLASEFPEYKDRIHQLKTSNAHFARLFEEYHDLDRQLHRIEQEIDPVSNDDAEALKKKRVALKDELFGMLQKAA